VLVTFTLYTQTNEYANSCRNLILSYWLRCRRLIRQWLSWNWTSIKERGNGVYCKRVAVSCNLFMGLAWLGCITLAIVAISIQLCRSWWPFLHLLIGKTINTHSVCDSYWIKLYFYNINAIDLFSVLFPILCTFVSRLVHSWLELFPILCKFVSHLIVFVADKFHCYFACYSIKDVWSSSPSNVYFFSQYQCLNYLVGMLSIVHFSKCLFIDNDSHTHCNKWIYTFGDMAVVYSTEA